MALGTAFRAFFAALFNQEVADQLRNVLDHPDAAPSALPSPVDGTPITTPGLGPALATPAVVDKAKPKSTAVRSDAVTLLATLQREARFVDLVQENLSQYSDAQIGAAARPCLQQCARTLDRLFGLRSIESADEGQLIAVPESAPPSRYLWIGEGSGNSGTLVHHGWQASQVELPQWSGSDADSKVVAPVQVKRA